MIKPILVFIICAAPITAMAAGASNAVLPGGGPVQYFVGAALAVIGYFLARTVNKIDEQGRVLFKMNTRLANLEGRHERNGP